MAHPIWSRVIFSDLWRKWQNNLTADRGVNKNYRTPQWVDRWRFPTTFIQKSQPQVNFWKFKLWSRANVGDRQNVSVITLSLCAARTVENELAVVMDLCINTDVHAAVYSSCSPEITTSRNATPCLHAMYCMSNHQQATRRVVCS